MPFSLTGLRDLFLGMRSTWGNKVDGPMLWGYFFLDPSKEKLGRLADHLVAQGYRVVRLEDTDSEDGDAILHVEKVEVHTPLTLSKRNEELEALANRFGVESYDGMDCGLVPEG